MTIEVLNAQRDAPASPARIARLARCATRRLGIRTPGILSIALLDRRQMRRLNRRFLAQDRTTDVLSFRYDGAWPASIRRRQIVGDILIAPALARDYAGAHGVTYSEEVARYVLHGILHWLGHEDKTPAQQRAMRRKEEWLLAQCRDRSIFPGRRPRGKMDQSR